MEVIQQIAAAIKRVDGVKLLNVDPGQAANRTVMTFAGAPESVVEAAFQAIKAASELIDMRQQQGEHPRMGATDVCPLIPIANMEMDEAVEWSRKLAQRVGEELLIPTFLYEESATAQHRRNLAHIRKGEFEGLTYKLQRPEWQPDFGPNLPHERAGATVIGARKLLVAYNVNLNTTSAAKAHEVAVELRESGKLVKTQVKGEEIQHEQALPKRIPGSLKAVKAIGWYIEEYGLAQISMNLTDVEVTPLHVVFDEAVKQAQAKGLRVTGSEIVGMVPLKVLTEAGRHYLLRQGLSAGASEQELVEVAVRTLGLNDTCSFNPEEKVIEYNLHEKDSDSYRTLSLEQYTAKVASGLHVPGGGSVAALAGAFALSLGGMMANNSAQKRGWEQKLEHFSALAEQAQQLRARLLELSEEDSRAFSAVMTAIKMPRKTDEERRLREEALSAAYHGAAQVPLQVLQRCQEALPLLEELQRNGNPNARMDLETGILLLQATAEAAWQFVKVNLKEVPESEAEQKQAQDIHLDVQKNLIKLLHLRHKA